MLKVISFDLEGEFAAFRDPSVTTNQVVYLIPSKTQVLGLVGALIGIERENILGPLYSKSFLDFLGSTKIGLKFEGEPIKISFFTNHHSFKEKKLKPVKKEILVNPKYKIFVKTCEPYFSRLRSVLSERNFKYTPFLGHSYCLAKINNFKLHDASEFGYTGISTGSVVLDETIERSQQAYSSLDGLAHGENQNSPVMLTIERHLHNFMKEGVLKKLVLRHWIPMRGTTISFSYKQKLNLVEFLKIDSGDIVCFY